MGSQVSSITVTLPENATLMHENTKHITNNGEEEIPLGIEPHGMWLYIEPGHTFRLVTRSKQPSQWEVVVNEEGICLWAAAFFTFEIFDGDELVFESNYPVPSGPSGMTAREFIGMMFSPESFEAGAHPWNFVIE